MSEMITLPADTLLCALHDLKNYTERAEIALGLIHQHHSDTDDEGELDLHGRDMLYLAERASADLQLIYRECLKLSKAIERAQTA